MTKKILIGVLSAGIVGILALGIPWSSIPKNIQFETPHGDSIQVQVVYSVSEQTKGLSGVPSDQFRADQGMLFFYSQNQTHSFWMPDTYFDLDIFFLDSDFRVIEIARDTPHHPGRSETPPIPRTRAVYSRYVFEMRSDSEIAKKIQIGDHLIWKARISPDEVREKLKEVDLKN